MRVGGITEDAVEQAALQWLAGLGWSIAHGPDISPLDAKTPGTERATYREVVLAGRLFDAVLPRPISGKLCLLDVQLEHEDGLA